MISNKLTATRVEREKKKIMYMNFVYVKLIFGKECYKTEKKLGNTCDVVLSLFKKNILTLANHHGGREQNGSLCCRFSRHSPGARDG